LLEKRAARLQPDAARTGGITAMKKIASMADAHYVTFAPHNPNGPICTAASLDIAASSPNFLIMEEGSARTELYNDIFQDGWKATLGSWRVPESPGLGVDFSPQFLKEYKVNQ
jgi:galactonate dehydratase